MKRLSRGTPYVMTTGDVETALASLTPRVEESIASLMDMTVAQWRRQTKTKKAAQIVRFTNSGQLAALLAAAAKAHTDLEASAFAVTESAQAKTLADRVRELEDLTLELMEQREANK